MTSIVLKKDVTMLDIQSTRMLGQVGFLAKVWRQLSLGISLHAHVVVAFIMTNLKNAQFFLCLGYVACSRCTLNCLYFGTLLQVFSTFEELEISVDVVATSEVSVSLTLDPAKLWERALIEQARCP
jgi:aspartokinase